MSRKKLEYRHPPPPGARLIIRDEEWVVRYTDNAPGDYHLITVAGLSPLIRDQEWTFLSNLDWEYSTVNPKDFVLTQDDSPNFLASRLHIESLLRESPPADGKLYLGHKGAMDPVQYQRAPALQALEQPRPRILIADGTGLGKTIEAGILISELIRRGKGKRILVVALKSMLTQFQKELWVRFAIPLVRLDSVGIRRVKDQLPAGHNPFHHFEKSIISIDTLKQAKEYGTFIKNSHWDIVVIDEAQNVAKHGTRSQRHKLAALLAERSDALIMLSATPHDGRAESFASLMTMLDPTAIADPNNYTREDLESKKLFVRRHKKDIRNEVGSALKGREVTSLHVKATKAEEAAFDLIAEKGSALLRQRVGEGWLLRTFLEKSVLSSPMACHESVQKRIAKLQKSNGDEESIEALERLAVTLAKIDADSFSKYQLLLSTLREWEWTGKNSQDRLVIFSERIATLEFLKEHLAKDLGLSGESIDVLTGKLPDYEQQEIVENFGKVDAPVRLLLSSDVGSEGINLHYHCCKLVHFDVPWSLMLFQQRNGRIDRYGQSRIPRITYLLTDSDNERFRGDRHVLDILIRKEKEAENNIGDPGSILAVYDVPAEERIVAKAIEHGVTGEEEEDFIKVHQRTHKRKNKSNPLDWLRIPTKHPVKPESEQTGTLPSLFDSDYAYTRAALAHVQRDWAKHVGYKVEATYNDDIQQLEVRAPQALRAVIRALPAEARPKNQSEDPLIFTGSADKMKHAIKTSQSESEHWPALHFLWPIHPFMQWITDKARLSFKRLHAPVIGDSQLEAGEVEYLITVLWPNRRGSTVHQRWYLVGANAAGCHSFRDFDRSKIYGRLRSDRIPNAGCPQKLIDEAQKGIGASVDFATERAGSDHRSFLDEWNPKVDEHLEELRILRQRHEEVVESSIKGLETIREWRREEELKSIKEKFEKFTDWIENSMRTEEKPYVQLVAAIVGTWT